MGMAVCQQNFIYKDSPVVKNNLFIPALVFSLCSSTLQVNNYIYIIFIIKITSMVSVS